MLDEMWKLVRLMWGADSRHVALLRFVIPEHLESRFILAELAYPYDYSWIV